MIVSVGLSRLGMLKQQGRPGDCNFKDTLMTILVTLLNKTKWTEKKKKEIITLVIFPKTNQKYSHLFCCSSNHLHLFIFLKNALFFCLRVIFCLFHDPFASLTKESTS